MSASLANAASTCALVGSAGGHEKRRRMSDHRPNAMTTIGRNSFRRNVATIVTSGIESADTSAPPSDAPTGRRSLTPNCIDDPSGDRIRSAAPSPKGIVAACAPSARMSGSWIVTGRLLVPTRSKCDASS